MHTDVVALSDVFLYLKVQVSFQQSRTNTTVTVLLSKSYSLLLTNM